jgi:hypothetical protein
LTELLYFRPEDVEIWKGSNIPYLRSQKLPSYFITEEKDATT